MLSLFSTKICLVTVANCCFSCNSSHKNAGDVERFLPPEEIPDHETLRYERHRRRRDVPPAAPKAIPIFLLTFIQCIISLKTHIPALMPHWKLFISRVGFPEHFWCQFCVQSFWGWRSSLNAKSFVLFLAITIQSWWRGTLGRRKAAKRKWAVETIRRCVKSSPSLQTSHSLTIRC